MKKIRVLHCSEPLKLDTSVTNNGAQLHLTIR